MFIIEQLIARSSPQVFGFLAELERMPSWYSAVTRVRRLSAGPTEKGSTFEFTRQVAGKAVTNRVIVSAFEPGAVLELASISGPTPFIYRYELETAFPRHTVLRLRGRISGSGLAGPLSLLAPVAESFFEAGMRSNLHALGTMLEEHPWSA